MSQSRPSAWAIHEACVERNARRLLQDAAGYVPTSTDSRYQRVVAFVLNRMAPKRAVVLDHLYGLSSGAALSVEHVAAALKLDIRTVKALQRQGLAEVVPILRRGFPATRTSSPLGRGAI